MAKWISIFVIIMAMFIARPIFSKDCDQDLEEWLKCNNPLVMRYLQKLELKDIGTVLSGVKLTDGKDVLKGYKFLGKAKHLEKGINLYVFEYIKHKIAVVWIEEGGTELSLPSCSDISYRDFGENAHVLSGDVHTYNTLKPSDGIIIVSCIKEDWLN